MATILKFPASSAYLPLRIASKAKHHVEVRITDPRRPKEARWHMQWPMLRAAGGRCLKGFNNATAQRGSWHQFKVRRALLARFLRDIEELVTSDRVDVGVNGLAVKIIRLRRA